MLALATVVVKIIGAVYKLPLNQILGKDGFGYFYTAYDIYYILLMVSTTGLPVAMSRMISEAKTLGQTKQIRQTYRAARILFLTIGTVGTLGMALLCRWLAGVMSSEQSWFAILCLAPAVLFVGVLSVERGFFQGQSNMIPTSVSQIIEAAGKLVIGLTLAGVFMMLQKNAGLLTAQPDGSALPAGSPEAAALSNAHAKAAGLAILGVTLGTVVAAVYMVLRRRKADAELEECTDPTVSSTRATMKKLLAISIPITLGSVGLQIITTVDAAVFMAQLKGPAGLADQADGLKGIYNFAQTVYNMPCAFITPLAISTIPALTEQLTLNQRRRANTIAESGTRVMALIAMPCSVGLAVLSEPIMQLLGRYPDPADVAIASTLMRILAACVFFNSFVLLMNAILQAHGFVVLPVINMLVGGVAKVIITYVLVRNPEINIIGVPISTVACYALIALLDLIVIRRELKDPPKLLRIVGKPALAAVAMGGVAFLLNSLSLRLGLPLVLRTGFSILGAGVIYVVLVVLMKIITPDDCSLIPKGEKIAKLLRIR
ncbi:MAG: polysaccharide biosynthesis protein [Oscillospiraceae bacterium]|nr:polysaccharide biosynthesis protein [Oscillospiraceae bacterium]